MYGDYGIVHPDFSAGGPNKNRNSKIRYTSGNKIRYFRGHKLADPPYFSKYHELAERVRSSSIFRGADFSFGDQYVEDCADLNAGTGSLGTWVAADMNHHFEYTAVQIARIKVALHLAKSIEDTAQLVSVD